MIRTLYGAAFGSPFSTDAEEIAASQAGHWHPMSEDFQAAAGHGAAGVTSLADVMTNLARLRNGQLNRLNLIGHANPRNFSFAGTMNPRTGTIDFAEGSGVPITVEEIRRFQTNLQALRPKFAPQAFIVLYGCRAGLTPELPRALADALGVTVKWFRNRIECLLDYSGTRVTGRGRMAYTTPGTAPATPLPSYAGLNPSAATVAAQRGFDHLIPDLIVCPNPLTFSSTTAACTP